MPAPGHAGCSAVVLDTARIPSDQSAGAMAATQLAAVILLLAERTLLTGDRYYSRVKFGVGKDLKTGG